jgi:hypothetical protein
MKSKLTVRNLFESIYPDVVVEQIICIRLTVQYSLAQIFLKRFTL